MPTAFLQHKSNYVNKNLDFFDIILLKIYYHYGKFISQKQMFVLIKYLHS